MVAWHKHICTQLVHHPFGKHVHYHPARNFSEWMEKVDDTENRGRSINQGKSQINASLKKLLKGFNMNASKLPVIDTKKDENKDSYYTTILKSENVDIPEELNDTSLCQND